MFIHSDKDQIWFSFNWFGLIIIHWTYHFYEIILQSDSISYHLLNVLREVFLICFDFFRIFPKFTAKTSKFAANSNAICFMFVEMRRSNAHYQYKHIFTTSDCFFVSYVNAIAHIFEWTLKVKSSIIKLLSNQSVKSVQYRR